MDPDVQFGGGANWSASNIIITPSGDVVTTSGDLVASAGGGRGQYTDSRVVLGTPPVDVSGPSENPNYMIYILGYLALTQFGII